jgi:hypothetical protein
MTTGFASMDGAFFDIYWSTFIASARLRAMCGFILRISPTCSGRSLPSLRDRALPLIPGARRTRRSVPANLPRPSLLLEWQSLFRNPKTPKPCLDGSSGGFGTAT